MNHLHHFEEMLCITKLIPKGDIPEPNDTLQVQWFYMSFHCSDRTEYVRSGRKLDDETLQTLAEYFESIFLLSLAMAQFSGSMTTSFALPRSASFAASWRSGTGTSSRS